MAQLDASDVFNFFAGRLILTVHLWLTNWGLDSAIEILGNGPPTVGP